MSGRKKREKNPEECRLLTFCFVLSSITMELFFSSSTLVEGITKKKEHRHAYLISFSTGSHKRNCQDTFRNVSIKSKSSRNGGGSRAILNYWQTQREALFVFAKPPMCCFTLSSRLGGSGIGRPGRHQQHGPRLSEGQTGWERDASVRKTNDKPTKMRSLPEFDMLGPKDGGREGDRAWVFETQRLA